MTYLLLDELHLLVSISTLDLPAFSPITIDIKSEEILPISIFGQCA
jgi:hypothetical protein